MNEKHYINHPREDYRDISGPWTDEFIASSVYIGRDSLHVPSAFLDPEVREVLFYSCDTVSRAIEKMTSVRI